MSAAAPTIRDVEADAAQTSVRSHHGILTEADACNRIRSFLKRSTGITIAEQRNSLVMARLDRRMDATGHGNIVSYARFLAEPGGVPERDLTIRALTTNLTSFFREVRHFEHLADIVMPDIARRLADGERIRAWSAGCSTGEEAWSMAAIVRAAVPDVARRDFRILATDIDEDVIAHGQAAVYQNDPGTLPPALSQAIGMDAYKGSPTFVIPRGMQPMVRFAKLNLMAPDWPMSGRFDFLFCRNTAIYFDQQDQETLWSRFADAIVPGGHLYIGHSERLTGPASTAFKRCSNTVFKRL